MRGGVMRSFIKRVIDLLGSLAGLIILSPFLLYTAYRIYRESGMPVFYNRPRAGRLGKPFLFYKFRTMSDECDEAGNLLPDEERITAVGAEIRSSSLDELPQLLNVLKGDMSLVGPRPLPLDYVPLYDAYQRRRLDVPQGITGWAQINGRNATTWEERFANDVWYVENWSPVLDLKILFLTAVKVIKREGISAGNEATMPRFRGSGGGREDGYSQRQDALP